MNHFRSRRNIHGVDDKKRLDSYVNRLSNDIDRLYDAYVRQNNAKVGYPMDTFTLGLVKSRENYGISY